MRRNGFSLLEFTFVLIITSFLFSASLNWYNSYIKSINLNEQAKKLEAIKLALENYQDRFGRLPCPSAGIDGNSAECYSNCAANIICNNEVAIGTVPYKTIDISQHLVRQEEDDTLVSYIVDKNFTNYLCKNNGRIKIIDANNNTITSNAVFTLIYQGASKDGAFTVSGKRLPCNINSQNFENCNDDSVFRQQNAVYGNKYYDHIIEYGVNRYKQTCPGNVTGCWLYLDAEDICTLNLQNSKATQWNDKSINNLIADTFTTSPTLIQNHYLSFNSNQLKIDSVATFDDFTFALVFRTSAIIGTISYQQQNANVSSNITLNPLTPTTAAIKFTAGAITLTSAQPYNDSIFHTLVITASKDAGSKMYIDGILVDSSSISGGTVSWDTFYIGNSDFIGDIAQIVVYNRALNTSDRLKLENTLLSKIR